MSPAQPFQRSSWIDCRSCEALLWSLGTVEDMLERMRPGPVCNITAITVSAGATLCGGYSVMGRTLDRALSTAVPHLELHPAALERPSTPIFTRGIIMSITLPTVSAHSSLARRSEFGGARDRPSAVREDSLHVRRQALLTIDGQHVSTNI